MSSDKVQYKYAEMQEIAKEARAKSDSTAQTRQRLNQQIQTLHDGGWVGKGAQSFFAEMQNDILPAVSRLENALEQLGMVLLQSADTMREAEERAAQLFRTGEGRDGSSTGGGNNNGSTGGSSGSGTKSGTPITDALKFIGKFFGVTDNGLTTLKNMGMTVDTWAKKLKWAGPIGDMLSIVAAGTAAWESPNGWETFGEKITSFGLEKAISRHPIGAAVLLLSDGNQLVGMGAESLAGWVNEGVNDGKLADAIRDFKSTRTNADIGNVVDGVSSVVVDYFQANLRGVQEVFNNPTPLNIVQAMMPGGVANIGIASDPSMIQEIGRNALLTVGHTVDFVGAAITMGPEYVNLAENSMRVGLQEMGMSQGFSETASSIFGSSAQAVISATNPIGTIFHYASDYLPSIDFSDLVKEYVPAPTR